LFFPVPLTPISPDALVAQLRTLRDQIPGYQQLPPLDARSISRVAHVDADFMQASFNAIGASDIMQGAVQRTRRTCGRSWIWPAAGLRRRMSWPRC
jgi:hypothetical protein